MDTQCTGIPAMVSASIYPGRNGMIKRPITLDPETAQNLLLGLDALAELHRIAASRNACETVEDTLGLFREFRRAKAEGEEKAKLGIELMSKDR